MGWVDKNTQSFSNPGKTLASIDPSKSISRTLAKIDPGPAIGKGLASVDKFVGSTIPGGWTTVGVLALAVAAPYAAPYLSQAAGGAAINTAAGTEAFFGALASGASSSSAISAGMAAQTAATTAALGAAAVKGATVGGALGGARAALTGEDIVKGALTGAAMGGLTGGALSGVTQALVSSGLSLEVAKTAAPMLLQAGNSIAMGQDPALVLQNVAMSGALSKLTGNLSDTAIKNGINSTLVGAGIGAGTGALTSGIKGGDVLGGATTGAIAGGISSGLNSLTAPAAPAPVTDRSESWTPPEGYGDELSDLSKRQWEAASKMAAENAAGYFPEFQLAKDAVDKNIAETTGAFNAAKLAQENLDAALNKPEYVEAYNKAQELLKPAQESFNKVKAAEADYLAKVEAFNADPNRTQAQLDAINAAEKNYASLAQTYSEQYSQFDSANAALTKMYDADIAPLNTAAQTTTAALTDTLKKYDTDYATLNKVADKLNVSLTQLDQISKGELPSGLNIPTVEMGAPTTSGSNVTVEMVPDSGQTPSAVGNTDEALKKQLISDLNSGRISLSDYNKEMEEFGFQKPTTLISAGSSPNAASGPNTALYNLLSGGTGGGSLGAPNNFYTPLSLSQDGRVSSFSVPGSGEVYSVLKYNLDGTATTAPQSRPEEITTIYLDSVTGTVTPIAPPETQAPVAPTEPPKEPTEEEKRAEEEKKKGTGGGGGGTAGEQGDAAAADAAAKAAKDAADEAARLAQENIVRAGQEAENARIAEAKAIADADAKARAEAIIAQEQAAAAAQQAAQEAQRAREAQEAAAQQAAAQQAAAEKAAQEAAAQQAAQEAAARQAAEQAAAQEAAAQQAAQQAAAQQAAQEAADMAAAQQAAAQQAAQEIENARLAEAKAKADADAKARAEAMIAQEQAAQQQAAQQAAEQAAQQQAAQQAAEQAAAQQAAQQAAAQQAAAQQAAQQAAAQQAAQEAAAQEAAADAALANQTNAGQGSTGTGNTGTVGSGSTGTTDVGTAGTDTTGTGAGTTGTGSGTGTVGEGGGTAGTGTGTGSGSGSGSGTGSGTGTGTGTNFGGFYNSYGMQAQDALGGIKNLTPGLTQRMDYTLTGLPNIQDTINPMGDIPNMASGGIASLTDSFSNKDTKGIDGSLAPGLTKAQLNYILSGMPGSNIQTKAEGGLIEGHNPTFFSEGGLGSMDNQYVNGDGDGTSDSIEAMLADGEFVIPADVVADLGNGSNEAGASILNQLLVSIRQDRHPGSDGKLPKDSKGPLAYLLDAKRKVKA